MSLSMYQASVPVFLRALTNLRAVLRKGEAFATEKGFEPDVLLNSRLIADMFPLVKQVQIATDMAVRGTSRLAGNEPPSFPDTETDFAGLYARISRQLQPSQRRRDLRAPEVKRRGDLVSGRRSAKQQHRHARQIAAVECQDLGRQIVEHIRRLLET